MYDASNGITLIEGKMPSQMSVRFHRHLAKAISTMSKKAAETKLIK